MGCKGDAVPQLLETLRERGSKRERSVSKSWRAVTPSDCEIFIQRWRAVISSIKTRYWFTLVLPLIP